MDVKEKSGASGDNRTIWLSVVDLRQSIKVDMCRLQHNVRLVDNATSQQRNIKRNKSKI